MCIIFNYNYKLYARKYIYNVFPQNHMFSAEKPVPRDMTLYFPYVFVFSLRDQSQRFQLTFVWSEQFEWFPFAST